MNITFEIFEQFRVEVIRILRRDVMYIFVAFVYFLLILNQRKLEKLFQLKSNHEIHIFQMNLPV